MNEVVNRDGVANGWGQKIALSTENLKNHCGYKNENYEMFEAPSFF